jgi:Arc/MetJ family transcription regulator
VYPLGVVDTLIHRTNINLRTDLVDAAAAVLGTTRATETIHAALQSVVDRDRRQQLAQREFPDLSPETLDDLRAQRSPEP